MRLVLAALLFAAAPAAVAQSPALPRTVDGRPDFQGLWLAEWLTPLERPDELKSLVIAPADAEAAIKELTPDDGEVYDPETDVFQSRRLLSVNGELRSSWIVEPADGKLPLTTLASSASDADRPEFDNPEERPAPERCLDSLAHAPLRAVFQIIPYLFVQTPETIVIASEDMNPVRLVDMNGGASAQVMRTRSGHSFGRWENDTLIVETTHLSATEPGGLIFREALLSEGSRVIERFTLASPDTILYRFTVEDPALYSRPWLAEFVLERHDGVFMEYACHEGNSSMASILLAARMGRQKKDPPDDKAGKDKPE